MKIKVFIKQPGKKPYVTYISNTLQNLQKTVGGYIETFTIASDMCIICDEEGRFKDYDVNCRVCRVEFVGTIVFVGTNGDEFCDVPMSYAEFKKTFSNLFEEE